MYIDKKIKESKKIKNQTYNNFNKQNLNESNNSEQINENRLLSISDKLTERNPSVITFSNFNSINNNENLVKNKGKNNFQKENTKNNSLINGMNINNNNVISEELKNRIRYKKKIMNNKNYFNAVNKNIINKDQENNKLNLNQIHLNNENIMEKNIDDNLNKKKKNNISTKEKLKGQFHNEKDINNETVKSIKSIISEGNNNFMYDIKGIKNSNDSHYLTEKNSEKRKIKNNNNSSNLNLNDISIKSENSNIIINETNYNNINHNYKLSTIPRVEETFDTINIMRESNNNNLLTKEQILYYTHIIFLNHSSYVRNKECYMMPKTKFLNIMKSINIIKSQIILVEIDLIYDSISLKSPMINYSQFNQLLMKIIQKIYGEQYLISPQLTVSSFISKLIKQYNLFFENKIPKDYLYKYQYNSIVKIIQVNPNENQIVLINQIILTINDIYEKYFVYELDYNEEYLYKSAENLVTFCKDFEVVPQIINSTQAVTYYNLIIHIEQSFNILQEVLKKSKIYKNKGKLFTLYHFILFIIHMSLYSYTKIFGSKSWNTKNDNLTKEAKLLLFLEKLEHSKGMSNFLSKLYTPRTKPLSLIPPREVCLALGVLEIDKKQKVNISIGDVFKIKKEIEKKEEPKKEKEIDMI